MSYVLPYHDIKGMCFLVSKSTFQLEKDFQNPNAMNARMLTMQHVNFCISL